MKLLADVVLVDVKGLNFRWL